MSASRAARSHSSSNLDVLWSRAADGHLHPFYHFPGQSSCLSVSHTQGHATGHPSVQPAPKCGFAVEVNACSPNAPGGDYARPSAEGRRQKCLLSQ
jgi:hypothetical protein